MKKYIILLIIFIFTINISDAKVNITSYSNEYIEDNFIFGINYYTVINYTLMNDGDNLEYVKIKFKNTDNNSKSLKVIENIILPHSSYKGSISIKTATFFYITFGKENELIYPEII